MKSKLVVLAIVSLIMSSCKTKKTVTEKEVPAQNQITEVMTVVEEKSIEISSPVLENPETIQLAATLDGRNLYGNKCGNCHEHYSPADYSKEKWVPIMKRMQKQAQISDAETLAIYTYLSSQTN